MQQRLFTEPHFLRLHAILAKIASSRNTFGIKIQVFLQETRYELGRPCDRVGAKRTVSLVGKTPAPRMRARCLIKRLL